MEPEKKEVHISKPLIYSVILACIIFCLIFFSVSAKNKDDAEDIQAPETVSSEISENSEPSSQKKAVQPKTSKTNTEKETEPPTTSFSDEELMEAIDAVAKTAVDSIAEEIEEISKEAETTTTAPEEKTTASTTEKSSEEENTTLAPVDNAEALDYTEDEVFMLAVIIGQETAGDDEEIALAVGNVVLNRIADSRFPNNMYDVLTAPYQYGRESGNFYFNSYVTEEGRALCYKVARRLLNGERVLPANVVWQAGFPQGVGTYAYYDTEPYGLWLCY